MKTFKRALSCFLALLMIFGSFSVISNAAFGDGSRKSVIVETKFFVDGEEVTEVHAGDTVKVRIYVATDFLAATTTLFYVYPKNFMEFVSDGLTSLGGNGWDAADVFNKSATSSAVTNNLGGFFNHEVGVVIDSESDADNQIYYGLLTEDYFDDKGWISFTVNKGIPVQYSIDNENKDTEDDHLAEFTFKVKDGASGEGYFHVVPETLKTPTSASTKKAFSAVMRASSDTAFRVATADNASRLLYDVALNDTNTITLASGEVTPTTYEVKYEYAGDVPTGYTAPAAIQLSEGADIEEPEVTIPDGYTLTWSGIPEGGKMGTAPVTLTGTWAKKSNTVTYVYAGEKPDGKTEPEAISVKYGETITEPTVEIPEGYTLTWSMSGDVDGKMGLAPVTMTGTWAKKSNTVTYVYAGEKPDGAKEPEAITLKYGDAITEPTVEIPDGYTLTWTGIPESGKMGLEAVTLTGTWAKKTNTVTYVYAGEKPDGAKEPEAITLKYGDAITEPTVEIPDGYTLTWTGIPESGKMGLEAVTLTGTWAKKTNTVTYVYAGEKPDGAKEPEAITLKYGDAITEPTVEIPDGYTLTWSGIPEGGKMGLEAVTLTGTWAKKSNTVTYVYAGEKPDGKTEPEAISVKYGETITEPTVEIPEGYTLTWSMSGDVDGKMGLDPVTMTGTWAKKSNTVTYVYAGETPDGAKEPEQITLKYGEAITEPTVEIPEGYTLTWSGIPEGGKMGLDPVTLTGTWAKKSNTVTYVYAGETPDGAKEPEQITLKYGEAITEPTVEIPEGYTLTWSGIPEGGKMGLDPVTLTGTWAKESYTITYYLTEEDKAEGKVYTTETVKFEEALPAVKANVEGKTFNHWDYESESGEMDDYTTMPAYNLVAIANLSDITYTVIFTGLYGDEIPVVKNYGESLTESDIPDLTEGEEVNVTLYIGEDELVLPYVLTEDITVDCKYTVDVVFYKEYDEENAENNVVHKEYTFDYGHVTTAADFAELGTPVKVGYSLDEEAPWTWEYIGLPMEANTYFVAFWIPNEYEATFTAGNGAFAEGTVTTVNVKFGEAIEFKAEPVLEGHTFRGWTDVEGSDAILGELVMNEEGKTFYPVFVMNGSAGFSVELYLMNIEGKYDATPTRVLPESGLVGVTAKADHDGCQQYIDDWFSADTSEEAGNVYEGVIAEDGSTVLKLYYKRAEYDVVIDGAEAVKVFHGATVTAPTESANAPAGYKLESWNDGAYAKGEVITVTGPLTLAPKFAAGTSEYTINTYTMGLDGEYGEAESEKKTYTTDETVTYTAPVVEGFKADKDSYSVKVTGDGKAVINVYYVRNKYDVTIDGVTTPTFHGAEVTAPTESANTPAGYTLESWNDGAYAKGEVITVTGPLTLAPKFAAGTSEYTINTYTMGLDGEYGEAESEKKTYTTDETVTYTAPAVTGFTPDKESYSVKVTGDGKAVINVYYARAQYDVTIDGVATKVYYGAEVAAPSESANTPAGFHLVSWNNGALAMGQIFEVTGPVTLTPDFEANTDTPYTVEIYLMGTDGKYAQTPDDTDELEGTTDTLATAAHSTYPQAAWFAPAAAGNVTEATITGDGKAVLKLYFERAQYDVTIDGVATKVYHGATINAPESTTQAAPAGYAFAGWNNGTIAAGAPITVTEALNLVPYFAEGQATYTVEIYLQNADGSYSATASDTKEKTGKTGEIITIAHADYAQNAAYYLADDAQANEFTGTIAGDGSLVLKLYFKRAIYTVAYEYEDGTSIGSEDVLYGAAIEAPAYDKPEGMNLLGWFDKATSEKMPATMPAKNVTYVVKFVAGTAIPYTIQINVMDLDGINYITTETQALGTTGATQTIVPDYGRVGFTVNTEKSKLTETIAGDGSTVLSVFYDRNLYTATFDGVDHQVYYGASLPTVEPAAQAGKEFVEWTPAVPAAMPAENLEFTSTWKDIKYSLIYIINGTEEIYEYAVGETIVPIADPEVPGMKFVGWNKDIPTVMPEENVYVFAEFEAAVFKVTFVDFDGNVFDEKAVKFDDVIVLPASNPTKEYYVFKGWLNVPDRMTDHDITIYPDFERVPVRLVAVDDSVTTIDRSNMIITGLPARMNYEMSKAFLAVEGDGYYTLTAVEGFSRFGTGAKVEVYDNEDTSAPIEVFYIVIYGDVNGDAAINSIDGSIVEDESMYVTSWSRGDSKNELKVMAADLNKDGKIKQGDADCIINTALGITAIDQTTGTVIR